MATVDDQHATGDRSSAWALFLGVGLAVTVGYYVLPHLLVPRVVQSVIYIVASTVVAITVLVGVLINKPPGRLPWLILAAAQAMYSIGDTIYFVLHSVQGRDEFPDLADAFYLLQYPLICWALIVFIHRRTPGRDTVTLIDAAVLAVAAGLLAWVYLISPLAGTDDSTLAKAVSVAYPTMDLLVLAVALRLMLGVGTRTAAYRLLVGSLAVQLVADLLYALTIDTYEDGSFVDAFWFGAYFLLGAAALHPSMRSLDRRSPRTALHPTAGRLVMLATAALLPLVVLVTQHVRGRDPHIVAVALAAGVTILLVLARMAEQVGQQRRLAIHDGMTGAYASEFMVEAVRMACDRTRYARGELSVLIVDVDNTRLINEMHGHTAGDLVLKELAERLRVACRPGDMVARQGGDKFLVLLAGAEPRQAAQIAERLREAVSATQVPIGDETRVRVTVSIGLASMPADGSTPRDLSHAADQALYAGKRAGRNRTYSRHGPVTPAATDFFPDLGRFRTR